MEKRRFLRFDLPGRADLVFERSSGRPLKARTCDFSRSGISLETDIADIPAGDRRVHVDILPDWDRKKKFSLSGQVAWHQAQDGRCRLGVMITEMDPGQKGELLDQSYSFWQTALQVS